RADDDWCRSTSMKGIDERRRGAEAPRRCSPPGIELPPRSGLLDVVRLADALKLLLGSLASIAIALPDGPGELVELPVGLGQVVIRELAPLLLHLATELLPLAGRDVTIHLYISFRLDRMTRGLRLAHFSVVQVVRRLGLALSSFGLA